MKHLEVENKLRGLGLKLCSGLDHLGQNVDIILEVLNDIKGKSMITETRGNGIALASKTKWRPTG